MRYVSPTLFVSIVLCFALPFGAVVDCEGDEKFSWTGLDVLTASVEAPPDYADEASQVEDDAPLAVAMLGAALAGVLLGLFRAGRGGGWAALAGLTATLSLFFAMPGEARLGSVLSFLGFTTLSLLHGGAALRRRWRRRGPKPKPGPPQDLTWHPPGSG